MTIDGNGKAKELVATSESLHNLPPSNRTPLITPKSDSPPIESRTTAGTVSKLPNHAQTDTWECASFPFLPLSVERVEADSKVEYGFSTFSSRPLDSLPTLVHSAWALVVGRMINSEGVVIGVTESLGVGVPTPLRVRLVGDQNISDYVEEVQQQQLISRSSSFKDGAIDATKFNTVLAIRSSEQGDSQTELLAGTGNGHVYPLVIEIDIFNEQAKSIAKFDSKVIRRWVVERLLQRLALVMRQIENAGPDMKVADIEVTTPQDLEQIWEWNATVPESVERCIHDVFEEQVRLHPGAPAICAWDGDLTYAELDGLSSRLAVHLINLGVGPEVLVALCFEKSMWTSVAILGVLKAGGAFVLLDSALPQQRLESIVEQAKTCLILTSAALQTLGTKLVPTTVVIDSGLFAKLESGNETVLQQSKATPDSAAYVVFTSGSTGVPKGAMITHSNMSSALILQKDRLGLSSRHRMYDFVSYSFSLAIMKFFLTLAAGSCFCVPSDQDRKSNLAGSFASLKANTVILTPSIAEILSPEKLPGLIKIGFGGEKVRQKDFLPWWGRVEVFSGYGSSECTTINVLNSNAPTIEEASRLGTGAGLRTWVVDPDNYNYLLPPGCIGELVLEGPLVSRGYLNSPEKTATTFVENPVWLLKGAPGHAGRTGRLYRTGDLVQQHDDGTLDAIGRKDVQVKIRGQRVELGDVEHWVQKCLPEISQVVAEVITPKGRQEKPVLAAFLLLRNRASTNDNEAAAPEIIPASDEVRDKLAQRLPSYMVPTVFFSIVKIPMTATGKANRKELRDIGSSFTVEELLGLQTPERLTTQPMKGSELQLQNIWSRVLRLDPATIGLHDSFLRLGGDSIAAMKVISEARKLGMALTMSDMFQFPTIHLLAKQSIAVSEDSENIPAFSLLGDGANDTLIVQEVSELYHLKASAIKDLYPCTPLQEGIMSLGSKRTGDYVMQTTLELPEHVAIDEFRAAWEAAAATLPILRTRIVQHGSLGLLQVVLDDQIQWNETVGLEDYLKSDRENPMGLGQPLVRYALIKDDKSTVRWFVWTIYHALYDGWSLSLILDTVDRLYQGKPVQQGPQFQRFIDSINGQDNERAAEYWRKSLEDCHCEPFPMLPRGIEQPAADKVLELTLSRPHKEQLEATESTMIQAAWALVQGRMTSTEDVVFGVTVSGRNAPIPNMDRMVGPTIATVPLRIKLNGDQTISDFISKVQKQAMEMIPFEQMGLQEIAGLSDSASQATNFQTLLLVQPQENGNTPGVFEKLKYENQEQWFNTYAIMLEAHLGTDRIVMKATFDSRVIDSWTVQRLLERFEHVMDKLDNAGADHLLADIEAMTPNDLNQLWEWNRDAPVPWEKCAHELFEERAQVQPSAPAVFAWDGDLTYEQLSQLSDVLSSHLVDLGIESGTLVPLCFEKSMWTPVAMLAVLKAGAAFSLLDTSIPEHRLKSIVQQLEADIILSSTTNLGLSSRLCKTVVPVSADSIRYSTSSTIRRRQASPNSPMFVIFTSGSTGTPKGIILTHTNFVTSLKYQINLLGFRANSRVFDFASYAFDMAVHNAIAAFAVGGCLCIPSDEDRRGNIEKTMADMNVTLVNITPSVSRLIHPENVPSLETLILGGEVVSPNDVRPWWGKVNFVNAYGPAECHISTVNAGAATLETCTSIGKGAGLATWIVDPENEDRLLAPGCVGELLLEGPLVGQGYLNDPEKTAASFIDSPKWLSDGASGKQGRQGRMYKTGDLVDYTKDGLLHYIGRKDAQVKIRGQRVELGEVEHYVQQYMPEVSNVASEVILPGGDDLGPTLVAFLQIASSDSHDGDNSQDTKPQVIAIPTDVETKLAAHLPNYMIPTAFFTFRRLPMGTTGKTDRKLLREIGGSFSAAELAAVRTAVRATKRQPVSDSQRQMQQIWARVLKIKTEFIGLDDSFFQLGGNSIAAIKLVGEARSAGLELTVANIFQSPALHQVAATARPMNSKKSKLIQPFELLGDGIDVASLCQQLSAQYQLGTIQDAYPCTQLQEGLLSLSTKHEGGYKLQVPLEISLDVDIAEFKNAWERIARETPILRTRIVEHNHFGLLQVVLDEKIQWKVAKSMDECMEMNTKEVMGLGTPLAGYSLVKDDAGATTWFVLALHHALYDGWSLPIIIDAVNQVYQGKQARSISQFQAMIKYIASLDTDKTAAYWRSALADYNDIPFPALPASVNKPEADSFAQHKFEYPQELVQDITTPMLIRAAWAFVLGKTSNSSDVVYGATVSGRNAPINDIESIVGPVFATVPLRVKLAGDCSVRDYLQAVQQQATEMIPFEQAGLQQIAKLSAESKCASNIQTLLIIQPQETGRVNDILGKWHVSENYLQHFNPYGLMVEVQLGSEGLTAQASFDSRVIKPPAVQRLLQQLDHVLQQFNHSNMEKTLSDIEIMTSQDLEQIWSWNADVPASYDECAHRIIEKWAQADPKSLAICAWDGDLTYGRLNHLSSNLAGHLIGHGVRPGMVIPLCFEKSMWTPVATLAVLKAGAAFVLLETSLPIQRLQSIIEKVDPFLILSSSAKKPLSSQLSSLIIEIGPDSDYLLDPVVVPEFLTPVPSAAMFVVFTSGSTGEPKGATISHENLCTGLRHQSDPLGITKDSRIFDFASYAFDVACHNVFAALCNGACLCIPSDEDRKSNLANSIATMRATVVSLTPSVAHILDPDMVPELNTLILLGEPVSVDDAARWWGKTRVINVYGPAECLFCTINYDAPSPETATSIGKGVGLVTWVVDPEDHNTLLPPGHIGELVVEGPLVGLGYLNEPEKTAEVFMDDPVWLVQGGMRKPGRYGRMYKTGDLVHYSEDGSLVYIGRKDTQVKIRGQRVELAEVEYRVQQTMPDATQVIAEVLSPGEEGATTILAALIHLHRFANNSESLEPESISILPVSQQLQHRLHECLPSYMIPAVFLTIPKVPITPTGKTDRRQLRQIVNAFLTREAGKLLQGSKDSKSEIVTGKPIPETEQPAYSLAKKVLSLCSAWGLNDMVQAENDTDLTNLGLPDLMLHTSGLDSISIMSLAHFITHEFDVKVSLQLLMDKTTSIRKLASAISSLQHNSSSIELGNDTTAPALPTLDLKSKIDFYDSEIAAAQHSLTVHTEANSEENAKSHPSLSCADGLTVLLTGANGFIGTQILRQLLEHRQVNKVIAIVRGDTVDSARARTIEAAKKALWWTESYDTRLKVWKGDLSLPQLGLERTHWTDLLDGKVVDFIIHNGALVHWVKNYETLEAVNVQSTMELLQLAVARPDMRFVYVTGGLQNLSAEESEEEILGRLSSPNALGYSQTKFVAEAVVKRASDRRAKNMGAISIVRPGLVVGTPTEGVSNADDYLWRLVASSIKIGSYEADSAGEWLSISDVASVASITIDAGLGTSANRPTVNQINEGMRKEELWTIIKDMGYDLKSKAKAEWLTAINNDMDTEKENHPLWPVAHVFRGNYAQATKPTSNSLINSKASPHLKRAIMKSVEFLRQVGFLALPTGVMQEIAEENRGAFSRSGL